MAGTTEAARCPICGQTGARRWKESDLRSALQPVDLAITDRRYGTTLALLECRCGFRYADPAELPDLNALYGALDDPAYEEGADARGAQQRALLAHVLRTQPAPRSLLDVGAASGLLVAEARARGLEAVGVEPSAPLASAARARGLDVRTGVLPLAELDGRRFDIVTLVDVIEHVADPLSLLWTAREHVAEDGVLLVVTPDIASLAARVLGKRWWHLRLAHIGYFDRATLTDALGRAGLYAVRWWRPGWVFEVGYLAERVATYVPPLQRLVTRAADAPALHWTIPLNPRDSLAVIARPR
jgi:SAM-dependent methyltransferase